MVVLEGGIKTCPQPLEIIEDGGLDHCLRRFFWRNCLALQTCLGKAQSSINSYQIIMEKLPGLNVGGLDQQKIDEPLQEMRILLLSR